MSKVAARCSRYERYQRVVYFYVTTVLCVTPGGIACQSSQQNAADNVNVTSVPATIVRSSLPRITAPQITDDDFATLIHDNQNATVALYHQLKSTPDNLFFSPHSISAAFAMLYAGALGTTASEMAQALAFTLPPESMHPGFNRLDLALNTRADATPEEAGFTLHSVNQIWGQEGYAFASPFLDILAQHYSAGIGVWNFASDPEGGRLLINNWVASATQNLIQNLIPPGAITSLTRMVLTNAIYFYGAWEQPFAAQATTLYPFHHLDGSTESLPTMFQRASFRYARGDNYQVIALPYQRNAAEMVIWIPDEHAWHDVENGLSATFINDSVSRLAPAEVQLGVPKWEFSTQLSLRATLQALGMQSAFDPTTANLNGIADQGGLYVADALHKAFVRVDEKGTEAAAATGIIVGTTSMPVIDVYLTLDRPFIYIIRHVATGEILFIGRFLHG